MRLKPPPTPFPLCIVTNEWISLRLISNATSAWTSDPFSTCVSRPFQAYVYFFFLLCHLSLCLEKFALTLLDSHVYTILSLSFSISFPHYRIHMLQQTDDTIWYDTFSNSSFLVNSTNDIIQWFRAENESSPRLPQPSLFLPLYRVLWAVSK